MENIEPVLQEIVQRICNAGLPIAKIILFGSYAKGTATEDSDIDLFVIIDSEEVLRTRKERFARYRPLRRSLFGLRYAFDIIDHSKKEFEMIDFPQNTFIQDVKTEGRILYER